MKLEIPKVFDFLFRPHRYKVAHGGRGACKSWSFGRALLIKAYSKTTRIVCAREVQKSIKESVHHLLADQIKTNGLSDYFDVQDKCIKCKHNESEFIFEGLFRNVHNIKSLEGADVCWVEEAQNVSEESWKDLIPTIRRPNSEIWVGFNPKYPDDPTYKRFVENPPPAAFVKQVNYLDVLQYFPEVLRLEMEHDKATDFTEYEHIWLGKPVGIGAKIWNKYDEAVHVRDFPIAEIKEKGNCFMAMDPHSKFYPFCVWLALVPKNDRKDEFWRIVYNEWPTYDDLGGYYSDLRKKLYFRGSLEDIARALYMSDGTSEHGLQIRKRFIDTRFAKGSGGESLLTVGIVQEFAKTANGGLVFNMPAERIIDVQRDVILKAMSYNKLIPVSSFNSPDLVVLPHCKNVRQSLLNHRCVEGEEKEDEKYKDPSDALRICFAGMADERYKDPQALRQKASVFGRKRVSSGWMG
jgi:hypothetical protein